MLAGQPQPQSSSVTNFAPRTPDDLRAMVGVEPGPIVTIAFRPPCRVERSELSGGPDGPMPDDTVRALCRALEVGPGVLTFEADPAARHLRDDKARCYAVNAAGTRLAHIVGMSASWCSVAAAVLVSRNWKPGQNREPVQ